MTRYGYYREGWNVRLERLLRPDMRVLVFLHFLSNANCEPEYSINIQYFHIALVHMYAYTH